MNLHINVIRGCCEHGYFQQRGWEDVKHAKPLCMYANWAPFSQYEYEPCWNELVYQFTYEEPTCHFAHAHKLHCCWNIEHAFTLCTWGRSEFNGNTQTSEIVDSRNVAVSLCALMTQQILHRFHGAKAQRQTECADSDHPLEAGSNSLTCHKS